MLLRLPESQLKTHLLMRVDKLENDRLPRRSGCDFSCDCRCSVTTDNDQQWSNRQEKSGKGGKGSKGAGKLHNQTQQVHTSANSLHSDKTWPKCGKVGHLASVCRSSGIPQPKSKDGQKGKESGTGANTAKTSWNCGESGHMSSKCPKKKVHSVE